MQAMPLIDNFLANLRVACEQRDITQAELSRKSGIHRVTISKIFRRKLSPSVDVCEKLALAAGVRADTVFLAPEKAVA
jgi:transcriptional regulator with XRE-family HTH domain